MKTPSLETAIGNAVAEAVKAAMEPYAAVLRRLEAQLAAGAPKPPGRPARAAGRRKLGRGSARKARRAAATFQVGDAVVYRQGRGSFEAKVVAVDEATGLLTVERLKDGKKVDRPATKLAAAAAAAAATGPVKQPKATKPKRGARPKAAKAKPAALTLAEGQTVLYRQGRGAFKATVVEVDHATGLVKVKREGDGKVVTRPAAKLQPTEG